MLFFSILSNQDPSKEKLEQLYQKYRDSMKMLADKELGLYAYLAEDVVEETFLSLVRHMDKINGVEDAETRSYIFVAVRNTARTFRRHETILRMEDVDDLDELSVWNVTHVDHVLDEICRSENLQSIKEAIRQLPQLYQDVLSLYYLNEMDLKEIASLFKRKYDTVRRQFYRGKQMLVAALKGKIDDEATEPIDAK